MIYQIKNKEKTLEEVFDFEYLKRLLRWYITKGQDSPPWEGITWIIDLLPNHPKEALDVLHSYFIAHCLWMPDGRMEGLIDASDIIRAKYIGIPSKQVPNDIFDKLNPRDLECLVERTFKAMGYQTQLTNYKGDGGRDVIAIKNDVAERGHVLIECKLYNRKVGVSYIRSLLGVVADEKVNKGILVTSSTYTKGAIEFAQKNRRIELIDGGEAIVLMNKCLGASWTLHIERIIGDSIKNNQNKH